MIVIPTNQKLTNWNGEFIDRSILCYLKVGHIVRCYCEGENSIGVFYFKLTSTNPLKGKFMDIYLQGDGYENLIDTEFDLSLESITEVPINGWNSDLEKYEVKLEMGYIVTGLKIE